MTAPTPEALDEARELIRRLEAHPMRASTLRQDGYYEAWLREASGSPGARAEADALRLLWESAEAENERLRAERDEARAVVARCNNSFGSYSYHLNPHPAEQIEKIKEQARSEWRRAEAAEQRAERLEAQNAELREDMEAIVSMEACWRDTGTPGAPMPFALSRAVGFARAALTPAQPESEGGSDA